MADIAPQDERLRLEFNRWAEAGKGEGMEQDHLPITIPALARMNVQSTDNILDVGCGSGWLSRLLSERVTEGRIVGMDLSDEMVRRARQSSSGIERIVFVVGGAEEIPWEPNFFDKAVSVESSYYWPDPARGLREIFRVLREGGSFWTLINYYQENPHCHQWGPLLGVPTNLFSASEWESLFRNAGFHEIGHTNIPDSTPAPETYSGRWFRDVAQLQACRQIGALLAWGSKPTL
jgi:SAM-dependent methyltransferase